MVESDGAICDPTLHTGRLAHFKPHRITAAAAIMTDGSPTCGSQTIYSGAFNGDKVREKELPPGIRQHGIEVFSEHQLNALELRLAEVESQSR